MTTFVLIHGACHRPACWDAVASELRSMGHAAVAPDLPCDDPDVGLAGYTATVLGAIASDTGDEPCVFVGHSLGALTATTAASAAIRGGRDVAGLIFVAGIIPEPGKSLADLAEVDAERDLPMGDDAIELHGNGTFRFSDAAAPRLLYHDLDPLTADVAVAQLRFQRSLWTEVVDVPGWPTTRRRSIVASEDRIVSPAWSIRVSRERLGVEADIIDTGHSPMLARPAELAALLVR